MIIIHKIGLVLLLLLLNSCESSKSTTQVQEEITLETRVMDEKLMIDGYTIGLVKSVDNTECPFIIVDEKTKEQFDPINFDEEKYASYKSTNTKIYFKFRRLRMPNRCSEALPISIEDIKKRED